MGLNEKLLEALHNVKAEELDETIARGVQLSVNRISEDIANAITACTCTPCYEKDKDFDEYICDGCNEGVTCERQQIANLIKSDQMKSIITKSLMDLMGK